jgi:foldase protein PrsA
MARTDSRNGPIIMNESESRRRDDSAVSDREVPVEQPADGPDVNETMVDESVDSTFVDESDETDEYPAEPSHRSVVTMGRGAFIAMVTVGVIAILALGASTAWLALDRDSGGDDPVVAKVNGEEIHRSEYDRAVFQNTGEDVLENLILERLISNEARKRNLTADSAAVSGQIDELKLQFGTDQAFQSALLQQGLTEESLTRQFEISDLLRQMVADQVQVTDDEVNSQYQANAQQFEGQPEADAKQQIRENLEEQKANSAARDLLGQLREDADVESNVPGKSDDQS